MSKARILASILDIGVVSIVRADSAERALEAAKAVCRGGVQALEVTMTVPGAIRVLEKVADEYGDEIVLGAGTVLDPETARSCMLAGAQFFVSPSLSVPTIEMCSRYSKVSMPGALTPTEVHRAWDAGADLVKIFPVGNVGGPSYIRALKAPLPQVSMVPTGGVASTTSPSSSRRVRAPSRSVPTLSAGRRLKRATTPRSRPRRGSFSTLSSGRDKDWRPIERVPRHRSGGAVKRSGTPA